MPGLVIEREILIEAPVEVVWRTITEPDQISQWFADKVELVVAPGAHGYMEFGDQGGPVVVETVDPPTRFSFRWNHPAGTQPVPGNSVLVEFTLTWEEGGVAHMCHQAHHIEVRDGLITRDSAWCGGRWGAALQAEMAEAARQ